MECSDQTSGGSYATVKSRLNHLRGQTDPIEVKIENGRKMENKPQRPKWKSFLENFLCCSVTAVIGILLLIGVGLLVAVVGGGTDASNGILLIPIFLILGGIFLPIFLSIPPKNN